MKNMLVGLVVLVSAFFVTLDVNAGFLPFVRVQRVQNVKVVKQNVQVVKQVQVQQIQKVQVQKVQQVRVVAPVVQLQKVVHPQRVFVSHNVNFGHSYGGYSNFSNVGHYGYNNVANVVTPVYSNVVTVPERIVRIVEVPNVQIREQLQITKDAAGNVLKVEKIRIAEPVTVTHSAY